MKIRVASNLARLQAASSADAPIEVTVLPRSLGAAATVKVFFRCFNYDYILLNGALNVFFVLALLKLFLPFGRCRLVILDVLLSTPRTRAERVKTWLRGFLMGRAHRILLYHRGTRGLQQVLGLSADKFDYIPFKINEYELVKSLPVSDQGYIFCGGKTRRDFATLIEAARDLPYPVKIVTTSNEDIAVHGSYLDESLVLPPNVEAIRLDGSARPFFELMAASRVVALPLKPDISGVGIGVYIIAMAFGKTVVMTEGPATEGVVTDDLAILVPPRDPRALREALMRACSDDALRARLGANAQRYALPLGDERRLMQSLAEWLARDSSDRRPQAVRKPA
jgi:glycosyltransferase involved in cell wall biosynthesis